MEGFLGSASGRILHPLSYSLMRRSTGKRLILKNGQLIALSVGICGLGIVFRFEQSQAIICLDWSLSGNTTPWKQWHDFHLLHFSNSVVFAGLWSFSLDLWVEYYCFLSINILSLPPPSAVLGWMAFILALTTHCIQILLKNVGLGGEAHLTCPIPVYISLSSSIN